ncbi:MAG TPA: TlpA disulfide reductase family protein [Candidatus Limnocylindrales bacterium]
MGVALGSRRGFGEPASRKQTLIVLAMTIVAVGALSWYITAGFDDGITSIDITRDASVEPPAVGRVPTPFTGLGYDGEQVSLTSYVGKPLWLTFGASWCRDCRVESADLQATYEQFQGSGLNVLAVFINDPRADIEAYAGRAGLTFPIVADEKAKIGAAYNLVGIPTHIFIGRDGLIKEIKIGALSRDDMERAVAQILR